jgi:hypothetical protein
MTGRALVILLAAFSARSAVPAGADWIGGPALGAGLAAGAAVARSPYWPEKAQSWLAARLLLETSLVGVLGLGFSLGYHRTEDSNVAAGFLYRGHHGLDADTRLLLRSRLAPNRPRGGLAIGGSANFDVYNRTELLFFYPALTAEPYLELPTKGPPRHTFSFGLPCRLDFRRDLDLAASVGLELSWRWYSRWKKEGA